MTAVRAELNCIDIIRPFVERLEENPELPPVQLMGGIGSAALKHKDTVILPSEQRIVTSRSFTQENPDLSRYRQNNTLRDVDALVLSDDEAKVQAVERLAEEAIGDQLDISIFRLISSEQLDRQRTAPFGFQALKTFVSDRYVYKDGRMDKALFPFAVPIDPAVMDSWNLEVDGQEFPVVNPATSVLNYLTRSISGLRPKDHEKVQKIAGLVFRKAPELADWAVDGPGKSHIEFASILQTLRHGAASVRSKPALRVGEVLEIPTQSIRDLYNHEAFLLRDADSRVQRKAISIALLKSRGLGWGESKEGLVRVFQKFVEGRLGTIIKNK